MSTIDTVRAITQDLPVHQTDTLEVLDGQTVVRLSQSPVVASSVIITQVEGSMVTPITEFSVSEQTGVVTLDSAPGAITLQADYDHLLLSDSTIQAFIDMEDAAADDTADIRLSAADALDAIASAQALILKKVKLLDVQTDGPAVAKSLREHASTLREQVFSDAFESPVFDIAEVVYQPFGLSEKLLNDVLKQS
jgi:hypothetical protein